MLIIIISLILFIVLFVLFGVSYDKDKYGNVSNVKFKMNKKQILSFLALLILLPSCITIIPANNVGIEYNPFAGGVNNQVLQEGLRFKNPLAKIYLFSTEVQTKQILQLSTQTKDSQFVRIDIDVKYRVDKKNAFEVFRQFRTMSNVNENMIVPTIQRSIESVTTKYNVIEVLGDKRNQIYSEIEVQIIERFANTGIDAYSITFVDTDAGEEIEAVIKQEAVAKKNVDIAEQKKYEAEINKEKSIIEAEAQKEVSIKKAEAEAEAVRIIQEQLAKDPTYIEYIKWTKWNGQMPQVTGGNALVDIR